MGLFNKQEDVIRGTVAARMRPTEPKPVQEIVMVIEYFDKTTETISLTYNPDKLSEIKLNRFLADLSKDTTTC